MTRLAADAPPNRDRTAHDRTRFIAANTALLPVPLVPEIRLHLAHEAVPMWQKTEDELGEIGLPPPFWAFAWAGGQALARYVLDNPETVRGRHVLDLASGSGLVAIAASQAGATTVLAADIDGFALAAIGLNAAANGVTVSTTGDDLLTTPPRLRYRPGRRPVLRTRPCGPGPRLARSGPGPGLAGPHRRPRPQLPAEAPPRVHRRVQRPPHPRARRHRDQALRRLAAVVIIAPPLLPAPGRAAENPPA
jgi:hypothetical protein